jgi:prepilin-type processing-associated H-X9-DG protein
MGDGIASFSSWNGIGYARNSPAVNVAGPTANSGSRPRPFFCAKMSLVHDGASQTLLVGEHTVTFINEWVQFSSNAGRGVPIGVCTPSQPTSDGFAWVGTNDSGWSNCMGALASVTHGINFRCRLGRNQTATRNGGGSQYGSRHPGGSQFAFVDGSVKFLNSAIGWSILQGIATLGGNESIS